MLMGQAVPSIGIRLSSAVPAEASRTPDSLRWQFVVADSSITLCKQCMMYIQGPWPTFSGISICLPTSSLAASRPRAEVAAGQWARIWQRGAHWLDQCADLRHAISQAST